MKRLIENISLNLQISNNTSKLVLWPPGFWRRRLRADRVGRTHRRSILRLAVRTVHLLVVLVASSTGAERTAAANL